MTIRHLEIFVAVADCESMSRAAQQLYISQPAVSQAVQELEKSCGVRLFDRLARRLCLTEEGRLLYGRARNILDSLARAEDDLRARGKSPLLRIGASVTVGTCLMLPLVEKLEQALPGVDARVFIYNTGRLEQELLAGQLDMALAEGEICDATLVQEPVLRDEMILAVGRGNALYECDAITPAQLKNIPFARRESGSTERNQLEQYLMAQGAQYSVKWVSSNVEAIKRVVCAGRAVATFSRRMVADCLEDGRMRALPLRTETGELLQSERKIHLVYHKDKYISPAMETLFALCRNMAQD